MNPKPGWYPDPAGQPDTVRYWDGQTWSDQTQPVPQGSADPDLTHKVDLSGGQGGTDPRQPDRGTAGAESSQQQPGGQSQPGAQSQASAQSHPSATPPAPQPDGAGQSGAQFGQDQQFGQGQQFGQSGQEQGQFSQQGQGYGQQGQGIGQQGQGSGPGPDFGQQGPGFTAQGFGQQEQQRGWQQGQPFGQQHGQQGQGGWHQQPSLHPDAGGSGDKPGGGWWGRQSQGGRIGMIVGAVLVLGAIIAGIIFLPKVFAGDPEPTEPPDPVVTQPIDPSEQPSDPSEQPTDGPPPGEVDCMAGNGASIDSPQPSYSSTGVTFDSPPDWGFRFSKEQWTWIDDQAAWGRSQQGGTILGGVRKDAGFSDPQTAAKGVFSCLETNGIYAEEDFTPQPGADEQTTLGGMPAWKKQITYKVGSSSDQVTVYIIDSGDPEAYAQLITIAVDGNAEAVKAVDDAVASVRKG